MILVSGCDTRQMYRFIFKKKLLIFCDLPHTKVEIHFAFCAGANINPDLLLAVFLPALLFESSFSMEIHQIKVLNL